MFEVEARTAGVPPARIRKRQAGRLRYGLHLQLCFTLKEKKIQPMKNALEQKVVVIVGGTTGMGLSAGKACIAAGARVVWYGVRWGGKLRGPGLGAGARGGLTVCRRG